MSILPLVAVASVLFCLLCVHEFRVRARIKAASARLERGKARGGFVGYGGRKLP